MDAGDGALLIVRSLPGIALVGLFVGELASGHYGRRSVPTRESWLNGLSFLQDRVVVEPIAVFLGASLCSVLAPAQAGALRETPSWIALPAFAVINDFAHYWFHRWAHTNPVLWRVHATHHTATRMSVAVTPRLNILWRLIFPSTYLGAAVVHLGLPEIYVICGPSPGRSTSQSTRHSGGTFPSTGFPSSDRWDACSSRSWSLPMLITLTMETVASAPGTGTSVRR